MKKRHFGRSKLYFLWPVFVRTHSNLHAQNDNNKNDDGKDDGDNEKIKQKWHQANEKGMKKIKFSVQCFFLLVLGMFFYCVCSILHCSILITCSALCHVVLFIWMLPAFFLFVTAISVIQYLFLFNGDCIIGRVWISVLCQCILDIGSNILRDREKKTKSVFLRRLSQDCHRLRTERWCH